MNKGDRAFLQKNYKEIKYGDIVTVLDILQGNKMMVRWFDQVFGIEKSLLRKANVDELNRIENQLIVHPLYCNGTTYKILEDNVADNLDIGDVGFIIGVEIKENENEDIFTVDFGNQILKFDKNFMDNYTKPFQID